MREIRLRRILRKEGIRIYGSAGATNVILAGDLCGQKTPVLVWTMSLRRLADRSGGGKGRTA